MIMNGKEVKKKMLEELKEKLQNLNTQLGLTVVQIGNDPASDVYVRQKSNMAYEMGYSFNHIKLEEAVSEEEVLNLLDSLNQDKNVHGILVQMPLPKHLNAKTIQNRILPEKDVDGLTDMNAGKLFHSVDSLVPCTPMGIIDMLKYYNIEMEGKLAVVVGRSDLVGKPMMSLFLNHNATVIGCHSKTKDLKQFTSKADILVVAVGKSKFITADMVKEGAVVIDVGMNRVDGKLCGDVDFEQVQDKCSYITPVPGGVGQMTVAELGENVYKAYLLSKKK